VSIDYFGFLDEDIEIVKKEIFEKYSELLIFYKEFNHFLHKLKFNLKVNPDDTQKVALVALFIKALETFQSAYILGSYGLTVDAGNLNRVLFETMIKILYCGKGEFHLKRYLAGHLHKIISLVNSAQKNPTEFPEELFKRGSLDARKSEIQEMLDKEGNPKPISIEAMAREVGVINLYHLYYRNVSDYVHANPKSIEGYVILDENGEIKAFKWGPRVEDVVIRLLEAIEFMLMICLCLSKVIGEPEEEELDALNKKKEILRVKHGH
jgi:hypothetical protein